MELTPLLDEASPEPIYSQLYRHFRREIEEGRLTASTRLPSVRKLASHLGISRTPVEDAYQQLLAEGYVESKHRSGVIVKPYEHDFECGSVRQSNGQSAPRQAYAESRGRFAHAYMHSHALAENDIQIDFSYGDVDLNYFPFQLWKKLLGSCFTPEQLDLFRYGDPLGELGFREALTDYAYRARAVVCPAERIVVGAGTHHSIEQLCRLLRVTSYRSDATAIAVEEAMSDGIAAILRQHGYKLLPLRLEPDGVSVEALYASGARIVYTTPSHQFPYGIVTSIGKRRSLLNWSAETGGLIIEDDYDGEFRYSGMPVPSLQGLDGSGSGSVAYIGTFSRALAPAFRLSYLALPQPLADAARAALHPFDRLASPLHQRTLQLFMEGGHMQRHIRKMRSVYQRKRAALIAAVRLRLEPRFRVSGGAAGLHVLLEAEEGADEKRLIRLAAEAGVRVYPGSVYRVGAATDARPAVLLGYGGLSAEQIEEGRGGPPWL